MHYQGN